MPGPLPGAPAGVVPSSVTVSRQSPGCSTSSTLTWRALEWRSTLETASRATAVRQPATAAGASPASTRTVGASAVPAQARSTTARTCTERSQASSRRSCTLARTLVERLAHGERHSGEVLLGGLADVHHAVRLGLHHGAREQVAHVVMDVSRDAGPLGERGQTYLIVLGVQELAVLLDKGELGGAQLVAGAQGVAVATLKDAGTKPEPRAHPGPKNGEKDDRALGANAPAKRKGNECGKGRKPRATSFERCDEAEVTGSDAEQRSGVRQHTHEGAAQKRRHEAHRPAQDLDERGRRHGRKQRDHDRRAHRPARGGQRARAGRRRAPRPCRRVSP